MSGVFVYLGPARVTFAGELVTIGHVPDPVYTANQITPAIDVAGVAHRLSVATVTGPATVEAVTRRTAPGGVVPLLEVVAVRKVP